MAHNIYGITYWRSAHELRMALILRRWTTEGLGHLLSTCKARLQRPALSALAALRLACLIEAACREMLDRTIVPSVADEM